MVTPAMRRQAAAWLQQRLGLSERRAFRIVGVNRSTCRYRARRQQARPLLERMRELGREGWQVNHKRLYRLYQREGLAVRRRKRKRVASMQRVPMITPQAANDRWSMDFMSDSLATGRSFRTLNVLDEYSRECLAIEVDTSLTGARVARVLGRVVEERGKPKEILIDNGPEFTSRALDAWAYEMGVEVRFIRPGKPVDNAFIESFNGSFRDECLNQHWFTDLEDARCKVQYWRRDYNYVREHSSLDDLTPHEFAPAAQLQQPPGCFRCPAVGEPITPLCSVRDSHFQWTRKGGQVKVTPLIDDTINTGDGDIPAFHPQRSSYAVTQACPSDADSAWHYLALVSNAAGNTLTGVKRSTSRCRPRPGRCAGPDPGSFPVTRITAGPRHHTSPARDTGSTLLSFRYRLGARTHSG